MREPRNFSHAGERTCANLAEEASGAAHVVGVGATSDERTMRWKRR